MFCDMLLVFVELLVFLFLLTSRRACDLLLALGALGVLMRVVKFYVYTFSIPYLAPDPGTDF